MPKYSQLWNGWSEQAGSTVSRRQKVSLRFRNYPSNGTPCHLYCSARGAGCYADCRGDQLGTGATVVPRERGA